LVSLQQLMVKAVRGSGGFDIGVCSSTPQLRSVWAQGVICSDVLQALFDAVPHLAAGPRLSLLKQLVLGAPMVPVEHGTLFQATTGRYRYFSEDLWSSDAIDACLGPGDVARLVRCCPALELLSIPGLVQPGVDMSPLLGLWRLRELYVGGVAINDDVAGSVLAHMVGLRRLEVAGALRLTDAGVLALAGNKGLRELLLVACGLGTSMPITPCGGTGFARCFLVRQQVRHMWFVSDLGDQELVHGISHLALSFCPVSPVMFWLPQRVCDSTKHEADHSLVGQQARLVSLLC
jgi:hypothetical protein